jgi:hypothetical protein
MPRGEQRRVPTTGVNQRINTFTNLALALQEEAPPYPQEEEKPRIQGAPKTATKVHKEAQTIRGSSSSWTMQQSTVAGRPCSSLRNTRRK